MFYRIIPKGPKCMIHFTYDNINTSIPSLVMHNKSKNTKQHFTSSFDEILFGTLCFGTYIHFKHKHFFFIEDVIQYKSKSCKQLNWCQKYNIIHEILRCIRNDCHYTPYSISIGIPILSENKTYLKQIAKQLPYTVYSIEQLHTNTYQKSYEKISNQLMYKIFMVKADMQPDIYHIYSEEQSNKLLIPDYKTSLMMNSHFRKIKENTNLDLLEESDDEDDFEDIQEDKYVELNTLYRFKCVYNNRFNMWVPVEKIGN